eukprot:gnl/TRDRNA2_/TRDRNA2_91604_c0_seq6.p1 gnl/TRDRNA2_/TRDRNA2_91604_c0~~gnl/TRDRNA2_/TRDRNA2_91604_c0_seq6.p1  ORF type:complete len:445 (-),score=72.64 gnl/TRDRNA2_/TRDRNA2_91604_c0_seq6:313-1482(-)
MTGGRSLLLLPLCVAVVSGARRTLRTGTQYVPDDVYRINRDIAEYNAHRDSWELKCKQRDEDMAPVLEKARSLLNAADVKVARLNTAATRAGAKAAELSTKAGNINQRRDLHMVNCNHSLAHSAQQDRLLRSSSYRANYVLDIVKYDPGLAKRVKCIQKSIAKQADLAKGGETRSDLCATRLASLNVETKDNEAAKVTNAETIRQVAADRVIADKIQAQASANLHEFEEVQEKRTAQCTEAIARIKSTIGSLKERRAKLLEAAGESPLVTDCEVTPWRPGSTCSAECEGGNMTLVRQVVVQAGDAGAKCPALEATVDCNKAPCAVDCEVSGWSGWSSCSMSCGGGQRVRSREILKNGTSTGAPCKPLLDMQSCNMMPCPDPPAPTLVQC